MKKSKRKFRVWLALKIDSFMYWMTGVPVGAAEDACMCGADMENHYDPTHSAISVFDYHSKPWFGKRWLLAIKNKKK